MLLNLVTTDSSLGQFLFEINVEDKGIAEAAFVTYGVFHHSTHYDSTIIVSPFLISPLKSLIFKYSSKLDTYCRPVVWLCSCN